MTNQRIRWATITCALTTCLLDAGCVKSYCYDQHDCPAPQICLAGGTCAFECSETDPCQSGFVCEAHTCRPDSPHQLTCPAKMVVVAGLFCVDTYEASRGDASASSAGVDDSQAFSVAGVQPWRPADNAEAARAGAAAGTRLCSPEEWQLACKGPSATKYCYGNTYEPSTCNGIDAFGQGKFHLAPTGTFPACTNAWGVFDMNGNVWERVAGGSDLTVRGGAFNCSDSAALHPCDYVPQTWSPSAIGFRCCADGSTP
jgi:hypothetical protein